ncbi:tetratricopeptide repeat protein [Yeosuana sp. MJ-SS3]|uniref:Tetratricopeptide repeat protein n=1 Tax=Gilvirhabdus luticola TaxID=3079858 RepID=A0ABU3U9H1_9FLAO|nr:tetratricopeptide repeat protein [Yeosuana sp. MJ-SS3]MDU8887056.1 tetratricopeptide repeat protein [Yeosuana sp. MJ-SS3]
MKKATLLLLAIAMVCNAFSQTKFTTQQWQDDLKFLQETVHKDYSFLFKKTAADVFDHEVEQLYNEIPNLSDHEIIVGLSKIIALFKYGHTRLGFESAPIPLDFLPVNFYHFSDGVFIEGAHKDYKNALGAKVLKIGNMNIDEALKAIYPVVPVENEQFFKAYGMLYLVSLEVLHAQGVIDNISDPVEMTLEKNGKTFKQLLKSLPAGENVPRQYTLTRHQDSWLSARDQTSTPLYLDKLDKIYYFEYLPENKTVYVRHSQIQDDPDEDIPAFYERLFNYIDNNDVERLVLDVRLNGGGNNYKNKPIVTGIIKSEKINKTGNLFVIIGRRTFSACQNLVNELDNYTNVIFVGEPTGENINFYGDNREVKLPNSQVSVYLSFAWWQDKPQWENAPWMAPHINVDMSFEEYKTNKDPVMDAILSFSDEGFITDPMGHLTELFLAGKIDQLKADAIKMVDDPRYGYFNFESEFNQAGYRLLGNGQHDEAIFVFQFTTELFPNSANAWDSLAEAYLNAGNKEKAKEFYSKALKMDPDGPTGQNAKMMLNKIANDN